ncbi:hypothetical protein C2G38_2242852 [Gigaspora rosea]|uniref:Uncharacterized protein n=1 Tax=Gigaspora rosea TaxID=44941 RepID=A0A397VMU8_9GLOM|nr:hypothetical protein C2G38_2242852 [Gigaspora rosea]
MDDSIGTNSVGYCYDEELAFIYYQKPAEMGYAGGTYNLGYCYRNGIGVEKDEHKAFICYQKLLIWRWEILMEHLWLDVVISEESELKTDKHKAFTYFYIFLRSLINLGYVFSIISCLFWSASFLTENTAISAAHTAHSSVSGNLALYTTIYEISKENKRLYKEVKQLCKRIKELENLLTDQQKILEAQRLESIQTLSLNERDELRQRIKILEPTFCM